MATQAPNQQAVLGGQVQELVEQLNHVEHALKDERIDKELRERVGVRFQNLVTKQRKDALELRTEVANGVALDAAWASLQERRAECIPLFAECLDFVEGALARSIGLDRGLCRTADVLLEELNRLTDGGWNRFTILAEGEFFYDMAEIIRVRFPEVSIWSLPVAAHEFGHYIAGTFENRSDEPLGEPFRKASRGERQGWAYLHEHFADIFATYALGPAYACTCALLRFDPFTAHEAGEDHPSAVARIRFVLDALEKLDEGIGVVKQYAGVMAMLQEAWEGMVSSATGVAPELDAAAKQELSGKLEELWPLLTDGVPTMRYQTWLRAQGLAATLLEQHGNMQPLTAPVDDLRDVINAAWMARLSGPPEAVPKLGEWAETRAREIVAGRRDQGQGDG